MIQIIGGRFFGGASGIASGYPRHIADTGVRSGGMLSAAFALSVLNHSIGEPPILAHGRTALNSDQPGSSLLLGRK